MTTRKHRRLRKLRPENPDVAALTQLHRLGVSFTQRQEFAFYLYFSTVLNAELARNELIALGFSVTIEKGVAGSGWLCLASKEILPEEVELMTLRNMLNGLAGRFGGEYDGWETQVNKDGIEVAGLT